jgi:hypothetical protein
MGDIGLTGFPAIASILLSAELKGSRSEPQSLYVRHLVAGLAPYPSRARG